MDWKQNLVEDDAGVREVLAKQPRAVWFQLGIRVVRDWCMKVERMKLEQEQAGSASV